MTDEQKTEIEDLETQSRIIAKEASAVFARWTEIDARRNRLDAHIAELRGDHARARWLRLLATPDADPVERHAAYIRVQAEHVAKSGGVTDGLPEEERAEVLAEVERMRAQGEEHAEH